MKVREYFKGSDEEFKPFEPKETHELAEDFKSAEFEKDKEIYEYELKKSGLDKSELSAGEVEVAVESGAEEAVEPIKEISEGTKKELRDIFNVVGMEPDDVEKINQLVGLEDGIHAGDRAKLEFLAGNPELINDPRINEILEISSNTNISAEDVVLYYSQIQGFEGSNQECIVNFLNNKRDNVGDLAKVLGIEGKCKHEGGIYRFENVKVGGAVKHNFDYIVSVDSDNNIKFGVDGPFKNNWGTKGGIFSKIRPAAELNIGNIQKAAEKIETITSHAVEESE